MDLQADTSDTGEEYIKETQYELSKEELRIGHIESAIKELEELLRRDPNYRDAQELLQQAKKQLAKSSSGEFKQKNLLWIAGILVLFLILLGGAAVESGWFPPPTGITPTSTGVIIVGVTPDTSTSVPPTPKPDTPTSTLSPTDESTQEPTQKPPPPTSEPTQETPSPTPIPPPDPPTNFQISDTTETSLTLSWTNPANNYTQIILQSDDIVIPELPTNSQSHTIEDLTCGKSYNFTIIAINEVGQSESIPLTAQTANCPTPTPPPPPPITPTGKIAVPVFENGTYNIYLASADNGWTLPKEPMFTKASQPAFTKDGSGMTLRSWKHQDWAQRIIYLPNYLDVTDFRPMTTFVEDAHPSLNSRNEEILFHTWPQGSPPHIIRLNINANIEDKNSRVDLGEGEKPVWLGDDKIVFFHADGLYMMDKDKNNRQQLLSTNDKAAISVAPDNDRVALTRQNEGRWQIFTLAVSQGQSSLDQLTEDTDTDKYLPTWSPDGNYIAFVSNPGGNWAVWAMKADGSEPRELFRLPGSINGTVTADGIEPRTTFGWWEERMSWAP